MRLELVATRRIALVLVAVGLPQFAAAAQGGTPAKADAYPNRPVRIVVPFPSGASPNDITARLLGPNCRTRCANRW